MGLDVYVGTLTRYYTGDWQTIVQQMGAQAGIPVQVVRPNPPRRGWLSRLLNLVLPKATPAQAVSRWQGQLQQELGLPALEWNEDPQAPYFTDKPAWDCYGALVLWAAYEELPNAPRRETAEGWETDSAYLTAHINPKSRYAHLVADTEIWLPAEFPAPIRTKSITGQQVVLGSSPRLQRELTALNARTWAADEAQLSEWRRDGAARGTPLETSARLAFSIFSELASRSVEHRLPMKLDY